MITKTHLAEGTVIGSVDPKEIVACELAIPGQVGSHFPSNAVSRIAVDPTGMNVDAVPWPSLLAGMTIPLGDNLGSARAMLPDYWTSTPEPIDHPSIWLLNHAHVFGGRITGRDSGGIRGGQLVLTSDGMLIPASFNVMDGNKSLPADLVTIVCGSPVMKAPPPSQTLSGTFYLIGTVHRHFGHSLLEALTRLWAVKMISPDLFENLKFLVYEPDLPVFASELLRLAGVPLDRVVHASPHDVVEKLIVPDVSMRTHRWISGHQQRVWQLIAEGVPADRPHRKVFLSRRRIAERALANQAVIEEIFAASGYEVVAPETLDLKAQIQLARESISLAGCVGSQMYLAAFQRPGAHNVVMAPRNFYLKDDTLIHRANSLELEVVLGSKVNFSQPKDQMTWTVDGKSVQKAIDIAVKHVDTRLGSESTQHNQTEN